MEIAIKSGPFNRSSPKISSIFGTLVYFHTKLEFNSTSIPQFRAKTLIFRKIQNLVKSECFDRSFPNSNTNVLEHQCIYKEKKTLNHYG